MPRIRTRDAGWKQMAGGCYNQEIHYCQSCGSEGTLEFVKSLGSWWGPFGDATALAKCNKCGAESKEKMSDWTE